MYFCLPVGPRTVRDRLLHLVARIAPPGPAVAWQLWALDRAISEQCPELLPLTAGATIPEAAVEWASNTWVGDPQELPPVALWYLGHGDVAG